MDYNDLGFSVGNRLMVLAESQATWTVNIIIRALMYLIQTYHEYFKRTNQSVRKQKSKLAKTRTVCDLYRWKEKDSYIVFFKVYGEQRKLYGNMKQAVTETIWICQNRNVLKESLEIKEQEVVDMKMTWFDEEQVLKVYTKEAADDAAREATKETERRTIRVMVERMIKVGEMSLEKKHNICRPYRRKNWKR